VAVILPGTPPAPGPAGPSSKFTGTGPAVDGEIGPDGVNYGVLFETMVRAWAKSRMSSAGSTVTLEAFAFSFARRCVFFSLIHRSHSISFTRAQGIPKYKIGFGRGKGWESWERLVEGGGGHGAHDVCSRACQAIAADMKQ
jgi:hypothetical protein